MTSQNKGRNLAIVLDNDVISAPRIMDKIDDGNARITLGKGSYQDIYRQVEELSLVLKAGALPAPLKKLPIERDIQD